MILLDEKKEVVHDQPDGVCDSDRQQCIETGCTYRYAGNNILYHVKEDGSILIVSTAQPEFRQVVLDAGVLADFRKHHCAATAVLVLRDVGSEQTCVYTDDFAFYMPTEILK